MQNLLLFIIRHHYVFLFFLLQAICITLIISFNNFHQSSYATAANEISGRMYETMSDATSYLRLKKINEELILDNARLRSGSRNSMLKVEHSQITINDSLYQQQYKYIVSQVVNSTFNKRNNYIILEGGINQGIEPEMAVINSKGVVGIVKDVSPNFCSVISLLHKESKLSVALDKSRYFGLLTWEEDDNSREATLSDIPAHVQIKPGDTVVTRGSGGVFPLGITVGTVSSFEIIPGSDFYNIKVALSADFHSLSYCYVIKNYLRNEQLELEEKMSNDE